MSEQLHEKKTNWWVTIAAVATTLATSAAFFNDAGGVYSYFFPKPQLIGEYREAEFRLPTDILVNSFSNSNQQIIRDIFDPATLNSGDYEFFIFTSLKLKNNSDFAVKNIRVKLPVAVLAEVEQQNSVPPTLSKANEMLTIGSIPNDEERNIYFWSRERLSESNFINIAFEGGRLSAYDNKSMPPKEPITIDRVVFYFVLGVLLLTLGSVFYQTIKQVRGAANRANQAVETSVGGANPD